MRVSKIHLRALLRACERLGLKAEQLFDHAGVSPAVAQGDEYGWLSVRELDALTCAAAHITRDPAFGLRWSALSSLMQFEILSLLLGAAPALRNALQVALDTQKILSERPEYSLAERDGSASVSIEPLATSVVGARVRADMFMSGLYRLFKRMGATGDRAPRVELALPPPADMAPYTALFGDHVRFDQPHTAIHVSSELLDLPFDVPNPQLFNSLLRELQQLHGRLIAAQSASARVEYELRAALPAVPSMGGMARLLATSPRSLRRRLAEEGTTYSQLCTRIQRERACQLLDVPRLGLKEVAAAVGFADAAAFHRAFKRWTGRAPAEYRLRRAPTEPCR